MAVNLLLVLCAVEPAVVWAPLDALRPAEERPERAPVAWTASSLDVALEPGPEAALTLRWTLLPLEPGMVDLPLLGVEAAVSSAEVDGRPALLSPGPDGMQHLLLDLDQPREVRVRASLPSPQAAINLRVAPAARRAVRVVGPWELAMAGAVRSRDRLDGGDPGRLNLSWRPAGERPPRPTLLRAESALALRLEGGAVEGSALLRWQVSRGSVDAVRFRLDGRAEELQVEGEGVLGTSRSGQTVTVRLARPVSGVLALRVRYRARLGEAGGDLPAPWPESAETQGYATLLLGEEALVVPSPGGGVEPVPARALPDWAQGLAEGTPLATFRMHGTDPQLGARVVRWEPIEGPPTVIDEARYEVATADQGRVVLRARYQVRNDRRQFLRLSLPDDLTLFSATVAGRAVQVSRDEQGRLLIPLEKSVETLSGLVSFPVDLSFFGRSARWEQRGERALATPAVDAPIAYARWELVLPPGYGAGEVESALTQVPAWSSREVGLSYGRSYGEALTEQENTFVLDGMNGAGGEAGVTDPVTGTFSLNFNYDTLSVESERTAIDQSGINLDELTAAESAENIEIGAMRKEEALALPRLNQRIPSARPPRKAPKPPPKPAPQKAQATVEATELSQVYWNAAYDAYKENRFEDSRALLDEALTIDPGNAAANALQDNLAVVLDTSGESADGEEEAATRRVRDMARAKTSSVALDQERLLNAADEAERSGDLQATAAALEELVQVSSVLAGVEQAEQVDMKGAYAEAQARLSSTREKLGKLEAPPPSVVAEPEPDEGPRPVVVAAPPPASGAKAPPALALPPSVPIPRAGQILRFEARLVPEGQPLTANITYHPARPSRSR